MRWQRIARIAIAAFVIVFAVVVVLALRQRKQAPSAGQVPSRQDPKTIQESGPGVMERSNKEGKVIYTLRFESNRTYPDGRTTLQHVTLTLPDRNNRTIVVTADEAERIAKPGDTSAGSDRLSGHVHLKTSDGIEVIANEATYDDSQGVVNVPGPVTFTRGRMAGSGIGATYDRNRDVLWLLERAHVTVKADKKGQGALEAKAGAAGLARREHYVKFTGAAHIEGEGRVMDAAEITVMLTEDGERAQSVQLRNDSSIKGTDAGAATMAARDIDLSYGDDGRTLQHALLIENAAAQLPASGRTGRRKISAKTIDMGMAPDGSTVTNLTATENVQVDLPPEGDAPAKRIRAMSLVGSGGASGIQNATFTGSVEYRESRAARRNQPVIDRTARSLSLVVQTSPGFGAIQQAEFHGNVHFVDGTEFTGDAAHALYHVDKDQIDLSPFEGDPGPGAHVTDGKIAVDARTIQFALTSRKLSADTRIRSSMRPDQPQQPSARGRGAQAAADQTKIPAMLKQDQPVNITSNRLEYDGAAGHAVYLGHARLWQGDTSVLGDTIVVDDKTGNLEASGSAQTVMMLDDVDSKTGKRTVTKTAGTADNFAYDDARRVATYTMLDQNRAKGQRAHLVGAQGDVTSDKLELYLKAGTNELDRAEGYGNVTVKDPARTATGARLTYTAADEQYFMTGTPVEVIDITPPNCKKSTYATITFQKAVDTVQGSGRGNNPITTTPIACPSGRQ